MIIGDWSSATYITSQVFVSLAYLLLAFSYFIHTRPRLLGTAITSNLFMGIGFLLLNAWVGLGMCVVAICRDIVSEIIWYKRKPADKEKITRSDFWLLGLWVSLFSAITFLTMDGFPTLFAYFATMCFTISIWQKNGLIYRLLGVPVGVFWIIYNIVVSSFMGLILESGLLIFVIAGLAVYIKKNYFATTTIAGRKTVSPNI
ncbi:MAG: YgjV family protein [Rickettsiales bacterium]|jgi:hypothetical protein|nr:YgjV family protein [Rickettsiales bacterium]